MASAEDLPWIREELGRWIAHGEVDPAQSLWGGPLAALQRVGTLADVVLLYRVARTTRQGAWVFGVLAAIGQLQGRIERIAELPEPTPRTRNEVPQEALARLLAEIHATPVRLRQFVEQVESQLVLDLGWDRGVLPIARELVEHLDRRGFPEGFFDTLEACCRRSGSA